MFSKVDLETGELTVIANITSAAGPTSVVLKGDGVHAYITTRGVSTGTSGQIFEVTYA